MYLKVTGDDAIEARLSGLPTAYIAVAEKEMQNIVNLIVGKVHENLDGGVLNRRSGELYDSIQSNVVEDAGTRVIGTVWSTSPLAKIHTEGAYIRPHEIVPRTARALRYLGQGFDFTFAARVQHPGVTLPARPFMEISLAEVSGAIREIRKSMTKQVVG
jgi:phage gpG-like protein